MYPPSTTFTGGYFMTQFLKKNAKLLYLCYGVFCFLWILLACIYMSPYSRTLVQFTSAILDNPGTVDYNNVNLLNFCNSVEVSYADYYQTLFQFNRKLQDANNMLVTLGVVSLVTFAAMLICSNMTRKKYYISNIVSGVAGPTINIVFAVITLVLNFICLGPLNEKYDMLNWGALANNDRIGYATVAGWYRAGDTTHFTLNSTPLIIYGVLMIIFILVSALMIAYNVFRYLDTRKELNQTEKVVGE